MPMMLFQIPLSNAILACNALISTQALRFLSRHWVSAIKIFYLIRIAAKHGVHYPAALRVLRHLAAVRRLTVLGYQPQEVRPLSPLPHSGSFEDLEKD